MAELLDQVYEDNMNGNTVDVSFRGTIKKFPACLVEKYLVGNKEFLESYQYDVPPEYALVTMKLMYGEDIKIPDAGFLEFLDAYVKIDFGIYENLLDGHEDIYENVFNARFQEVFLELYPEEQVFIKHFSWDENCTDRCCPKHRAFNICAPMVLQADIKTIVFTVRDKIFSVMSGDDQDQEQDRDQVDKMNIKNMLNYFWWKYDYCARQK